LRADLRALTLAPAATWRVVLASVVVVMGHVATFAVAARVTGAAVPLGELVPVALLVIVVSGLPLNVAGWGPREGAAAWAFAAAGWDAAQGLAAAVAYGVLVLVANLPGAAVFVREGLSHG
jgi:glycosyltransferase 2 family protein